MEFPPREEYTDITVQQDGRWFSQGREIINLRVLAYFRRNLKRDEKGFYIWNTLGKFAEKGYIHVFGPLMKVTSIQNEHFIFESGDHIELKKASLVVNESDHIFVLLPKIGGFASLSWQVVQTFASFLENSTNGIHFAGKDLPIIMKNEWKWTMETK